MIFLIIDLLLKLYIKKKKSISEYDIFVIFICGVHEVNYRRMIVKSILLSGKKNPDQ